jgi:amino acid transporter
MQMIKRAAAGIIPAATLFVSAPIFAAPPCDGQDCVDKGLTATGVNTGNGSLHDLFSKVTSILFFIIGALGGIMYVTSAGDSKRVESAKNTILYAIIGIVVAVFAGTIVNFVLNQTK